MTYLAWRPDWGNEETASEVEADNPREAAERWAEASDSNNCEYPPEREVCVTSGNVIGVQRYNVYQYPVPVYEAKLVKPKGVT